MKSLFLFFAVILILSSHCQAVIGVGYYSKDVIFWRFWEVEGDMLVPKILVYNTSDKPALFCMRNQYAHDGQIDSSRRRWYNAQVAKYEADTMTGTVEIPAFGYKVFEVHKGKINGGFYAIFINGIAAGINDEMSKVELAKYDCRYYSHEGLAGGPTCIIGKDHLFSKRGREDKMTLYFNCASKDAKEKSWHISADINDGMDRASLCVENDSCYSLKGHYSKTNFLVNIEHIRAFAIDITYKITRNKKLPYFEIKDLFSNGGTGCRLPVLAK